LGPRCGPAGTLFQPDILGKTAPLLSEGQRWGHGEYRPCPSADRDEVSDSQLTVLVDAYQAGETVYQLAARFDIHRATVSAHLHRQGITLRRQGLDSDGVAHAVRLYEDGWSVARIGNRLGVDGTTAWTAIRGEGVRMRDTHGRDQ
jgi:hypothetical protein